MLTIIQKMAFNSLLSIALCAFVLVNCGKKKKNDHGGPNNQDQVQEVTADFTSALGVLVLDPGSTSKLKLAMSLNHFYGEDLEQEIYNDDGQGLLLAESSSGGGSNSNQNGSQSLKKVKSDGGVDSILSTPGDQEQNQGPHFGPPKRNLPPILTIGVSPAKEIYLHFQHGFVYKIPENPNVDPWEPSSGAQCQLFKVKGGTITDLQNIKPEEPNLDCIDNQHVVDAWQSGRNSIFQFDKDSNVFYPGSLPQSGGKQVLYRRARDGSSTKEMINANICVQDFIVTKNGGVFYTGTSSCGPGSGGNGGFFRYVSPAGSVREIARDWWNFVFEPVSGATSDKAVFFGPDPRSSTTASWDSACLFNFDPDAGSTSTESISPLITCGNDIWSWIQMTRSEDITSYGKGWHNGERSPTAAWVNEFKARCESSGQIFAGGGSQISSIKQSSTGDVYVIGNLRKKKEGEITCSIIIRGAHCSLKSVPYLFDTAYDSSSECTTAGGLWINDGGYCTDTSNVNSSYTTQSACVTASHRWHYNDKRYDNIAAALCTSTNSNKVADIYNQDVYDTSGAEGTQKFQSEWLNCQVKSTSGSSSGGNNNNWTDEYKALALVSSSTKSLTMLSSTNEQASRLWLVNDVAYYSSFNNTEGKYYLKKYNKSSGATEIMATNFETYNLAESSESGKLFYDGLDFSNNSYSFGSMSNSSPFSRVQNTGLTGTIKTIVLLPK